MKKRDQGLPTASRSGFRQVYKESILKVLVTGNRGFVGSVTEKKLSQNDLEVIGFDIKDGLDICDYGKLMSLSTDCDAIIHLAAADSDNTTEILETNVVGTMNVLNVFRETNVRKLIFMSSVDSLGIFEGEGKPLYLPIDDDYPCHPHRAYSLL
jgi:nucleoside-diphosphate-sugar epimerase